MPKSLLRGIPYTVFTVRSVQRSKSALQNKSSRCAEHRHRHGNRETTHSRPLHITSRHVTAQQVVLQVLHLQLPHPAVDRGISGEVGDLQRPDDWLGWGGLDETHHHHVFTWRTGHGWWCTGGELVICRVCEITGRSWLMMSQVAR